MFSLNASTCFYGGQRKKKHKGDNNILSVTAELKPCIVNLCDFRHS